MASCSNDDKGMDEEMCCGRALSEIEETIYSNYTLLLSHDNLSDEQRDSIEAEYEGAQNNLCDYYIEDLEAVGASCGDRPH